MPGLISGLGEARWASRNTQLSLSTRDFRVTKAVHASRGYGRIGVLLFVGLMYSEDEVLIYISISVTLETERVPEDSRQLQNALFEVLEDVSLCQAFGEPPP